MKWIFSLKPYRQIGRLSTTRRFNKFTKTRNPLSCEAQITKMMMGRKLGGGEESDANGEEDEGWADNEPCRLATFVLESHNVFDLVLDKLPGQYRF